MTAQERINELAHLIHNGYATQEGYREYVTLLEDKIRLLEKYIEGQRIDIEGLAAQIDKHEKERK
jgi:hypothetical protein